MGSAFFILASSVLLWSLKFRTWAMGIATFLVAANTYASYRQVRIYGDEERLWRETLALYPRDERAILNLSTYYLRNGKFKEAQSTLEGLLKMYPGYYGGLVNMGGLFQHYENPNRDPKCAIEFYNQALQVEPTNLNALMNGGLVLVELRRFAEARVHFEKIITLSPRMAQAHANLGRVGLVTGDPALAQRHLSEAVRLNPGDSASAAILDKIKPQ